MHDGNTPTMDASVGQNRLEACWRMDMAERRWMNSMPMPKLGFGENGNQVLRILQMRIVLHHKCS
jgi:hypothetical protein